MAILYKADGTQQTVNPKSKRRGFTLEELYKMLDCRLVEVLCLDEEYILIVDEEFLLKSDPVLNRKASEIATVKLGQLQPIFGNALMCRNEEFK